MSKRSDYYKQLAELRNTAPIGYPMYLMYNKLGDYVPSLIKGAQIQITATTDAGKSKFWRSMFLVDIYIAWKRGLTPKFEPRFIINLLEDTRADLEDALFSSLVYRLTGRNITATSLKSLGKYKLTKDDFIAIERVEPYVEQLLSFCYIFDNTYNATGLYKNTKRILMQNGKRRYLTKDTKDDYISQEEYMRLHPDQQKNFIPKDYIQDNDDIHWFVITDYLNLIEGELTKVYLGSQEHVKYLNERDSMSKFVFDYGVKVLQKLFRVTSINIIQQAAETENKKFDNQGRNILDKLRPSRQGYGENKIIARAAQLILGIFSPAYYGFEKYMNYDLNAFDGNYRSLLILKNKIGKGHVELPMFFNGMSDYFAEIPHPDSITLEDVDKIKEFRYHSKTQSVIK